MWEALDLLLIGRQLRIKYSFSPERLLVNIIVIFGLGHYQFSGRVPHQLLLQQNALLAQIYI